jgi:hypothetical protein
MGFRESLPDNCPPIQAHERECPHAFRFVATKTPVAGDFDSYAAKQVPLPEGLNVCPCRWASCSLYPDLATVYKKRKIKSLKKYPFVAELTIAANIGRLVEDLSHIDFWMYDTFDPLTAIVVIKDLDDG